MALRETVKLIFDIIYELSNSPDGISRSEITAKYGIGRSTAHKYIRLIEDMGVPIYTEGQKYRVSEDYFVHLKLTTEESEFLFLVLERSLTSYTTPSQIVRSLISKLSRKLHPHLTGELQDRFRQGQRSIETARKFTTLVQAKNQRREVLIDYYPLNRAEVSRWRIRPYRFLSNPISDGFYVLCDGIRDGEEFLSVSLKLDRIADAKLTAERFDNIDLARFQSHFGQAWGVWNSERAPTHIVLRFEPRHYDRLLESQWHPSQSIRVDSDGYVIYSVNVSEPEEMMPWIRSWGSGVVVEEPERLRQRVMRSLMRQVRNYGLTLQDGTVQQPAFHLLWAKYDRKSGGYHLLLYHLLDVAAVAWRMWEQALGAGQKDWLQKTLCMDEGATRQLLALLAGLHDIGKATPGFQKKVADLYEALCGADESLREKHINVDNHGILSAVILRRWLMDDIGMNKQQAGQLAAVIGGHHGAWISTKERQNANASIGKEKWKDLQNELIAQAQATLGVDEISLPKDPEAFNIFAAFLSGFVSVCDWIGSNSDHFPFEEGIIDSAQYFADRLQHAKVALADLGWLGWSGDGRQPDFEKSFCLTSNALQREGIRWLETLQQPPRLILVEYMTGGGKTELALHIGDQLVNCFGLSGIYIAMPTQATSNQMFGRFGEYLKNRYPESRINLQLIHAQAEEVPRFQAIQPRPEREGDESGLTAEDWFQNRKRALLAPFGVGTIDQAMLSVLQAKHHFVRQYALSQKLVIFDEIHSYDSYMNVIIERLFAWLHALRSTMILLSATLSRQGRQDILKAVGARNLEDMDEAPYPRLTVVEHDGEVRTHELPRPETRTIHIEKIPPDLESLLGAILPLYKKGGCIAIVCNTVDESIAVARFLRDEAEEVEEDDVQLFHARFPPIWRNEIENDVLKAFGKPSEETERPERAILVATQIIEQSLDLDFDLMISRTAPIDLLIQRAGRLHRHPRPNRPAHLNEPTLLLREPEMNEEGIPDFGVDEWVYARFFLLKSWLKLRKMSVLRSPDDVDELMNFVYSRESDVTGVSEAYRVALEAAADDLHLGNANSKFRGGQDVIALPSYERLIGRRGARLPDDEERHVATRDIRPGIDLICLTDADMRELIEDVPSRADIATLLRYKVTVRGPAVKSALEQLSNFSHWKNKPQLRFARPILFDAGEYRVPRSPYTLKLTREYGLEIVEDE